MNLRDKIKEEQERIVFSGGFEDSCIIDSAEEMLNLLIATLEVFDTDRVKVIENMENIEKFLKSNNEVRR